MEKERAICLEMRQKQEIYSRQDFKWRKSWEKDTLRFRGLSFLCFAVAVLYLIPVVWQYQ